MRQNPVEEGVLVDTVVFTVVMSVVSIIVVNAVIPTSVSRRAMKTVINRPGHIILYIPIACDPYVLKKRARNVSRVRSLEFSGSDLLRQRSHTLNEELGIANRSTGI